MIESGKCLEEISRKFAILKTAIEQSGSLGLTNIHKHCENFVKNLLNITYGYKLLNLNADITTYPALDLGDEDRGIAYQVTSERNSNKVEDTLTKANRHKHYLKFPSIRLFILGKKQQTYTISKDFDFDFDWKKDIEDFDSLLKEIQHRSLETLRRLNDYLEEELPGTISVIENKEAAKIQGSPAHVIDVAKSLEQTGMNDFEHWACKLKLVGGNFSVPILYNKLKEFCKTYYLGQTLIQICNPVFEKTPSSREILFKMDVRDTGVRNHFQEEALLLQPNTIKYEYGQYKSGADLLTNMNKELGTVLGLLFFCQKIYGNVRLQIELDIDWAANSPLIFMVQGSHFEINNPMNIYRFNSPFQHSQVIHNLDNEILTDLSQTIFHAFVGTEKYFGVSDPFISVKKERMYSLFDTLRQQFGA